VPEVVLQAAALGLDRLVVAVFDVPACPAGAAPTDLSVNRRRPSDRLLDEVPTVVDIVMRTEGLPDAVGIDADALAGAASVGIVVVDGDSASRLTNLR